MYLFLFAINIKRLWRLGIVRNNDSINIQSLRDFLYNEEMKLQITQKNQSPHFIEAS